MLADGGFWATRMDPHNAETWDSPPGASFDADVRERVLRLWMDRDVLLGGLDGLPQVFSHGDLHPRNILLARDGDDVVALDWAFGGVFSIGNDLADLVGLAAWFCDIAVTDLPRIEAAAFAAYEDGLRLAGWQGDRRLPRLGYTAAVALRLGACMPAWAAWLLGPDRVHASERLYGRPADAILATWIALADVCLELADEARELTAQLGLHER